MATIFFYESSLNKEFLQTSNPSLVLLVSKVKILKISSNQKQESSMVHVAMFLPDQDEMRNLCKGPHKHHL